MQYTLLIRKYRILRRMTQAELAVKSGVKQSYISQLEKNSPRAKSPTLRIIFRIALALEVCPHILIQYETNCGKNCCHFCEQIFFTPT